MSAIGETLRDCGRQMGLPDLELSANGALRLDLEHGGLLGVECPPAQQGEVFVYLARPAGYDAAADLRRTLARAHHSAAAHWPVQVAVRDIAGHAQLMVMVRLPEREFNAQPTHRIVDFLRGWFEGAQHG